MVTNTRVSMLGEFKILQDGQPLTRNVSSRTQALLAKLVLSGEGRQTRQQLAFQFWPDSTEQQARTNLRQLIHLFRTSLPECARYVLDDGSSLVWSPDSSCTVDVTEFLSTADGADNSLEIDAALLLYAGDLLPDLYDDWLEPERERLRSKYASLLDFATIEAEAIGNLADAAGYVRRLLKHNPLHEEGYRTQMRIASRQGDLAGVVQAYRTCKAVWTSEFGVDPSTTTRALYEELRFSVGGQVTTYTSQPAGDRPLPGQAPDVSTGIIGRDSELACLAELITEQSIRLVSLVGPGGIGKTRLALEVASRLEHEFTHGIWFVDLAAVMNPLDVLGTIASVLLVESSGQDATEEAVISFLRNRHLLLIIDNFEQVLAAARVVSRLVRAAPNATILVTSRAPLRIEGEREFHVGGLALPSLTDNSQNEEATNTSPSVQLFVERARTIQPLFRLTSDNASDVARICQQLDGIPLAIELAAARIRILSPDQIRDRLTERMALLTAGRRDAPPRHQTLREMIGWSYRLLSPDEQQTFARLALFGGGATMAMVEAVCWPLQEATRDRVPVLNCIDSLVMHNLLKRSDPVETGDGSPPRFGMLETIREYALERLSESGELEFMSRRHAECFVELAEDAENDLAGGPNRQECIQWLSAEHDNFRVALAWAIPIADVTLGLRLASALGWYWFVCGHATEGRRWLTSALEAEPCTDQRLRAKALNHLGGLAIQQAEHKVAIEYLEESLRLFRHLEDCRGIALTLFRLGQARRYSGGGDSAMVLFEECLSMSDWSETSGARTSGFNRGLPLIHLGLLLVERGELGSGVGYLFKAHRLGTELEDPVVQGSALVGLGWVDHYSGNSFQAISRGREALELYRTIGHFTGTADALIQLGWAMLSAGDVKRARMLFHECLEMAHRRNGRSHVADGLAGLGAVESATPAGTAHAITLLAASARLRATAGSPFFPSQQAYQSCRELIRSSVDESTWHMLWCTGASMSLDHAVALALSLP